MLEKTLENIGLTPNEAKIYRALLELKKGTIWNISSYANIHRRNTYDTIQRLIDKGLAYQVIPEKTLTYAPIHPEKLRELIEEKEKVLERDLPSLIKKFKKVSTKQELYLYKGVGGLRNLINLMLKENKDFYGIGSKGTWFDSRIFNFGKKYEKMYKKSGITSHLIYDNEMRKRPEVIKMIGGEYKFLPKEFSTESSIDIFGDYVAIYSGMGVKELDSDISIFVLKDKTLANDYMKWWSLIWSVLPKEK